MQKSLACVDRCCLHHPSRQGGLRMCHFNQGRFRQQVRFLQHQFLQDGNLLFSDILSTGRSRSIDSTSSGVDRLPVYAGGHLVCVSRPGAERRSLVPLGRGAPDRVSCRAETARCLRKRARYCQARKRLPEEFFSQIAGRRDASSMPRRNRVGCGRIDVFTSSTARPSRCPTPTRINKPIPSRRSKNPVWDFR